MKKEKEYYIVGDYNWLEIGLGCLIGAIGWIVVSLLKLWGKIFKRRGEAK